MKLSHLTACAAALALMGGAAAIAQTPAAEQPASPAQATPTTTDVTATTTTSAAGTTTTAVAATDVATGASVTVSTVTNGPVPDTAENRRKYGSPLSNAGKRTAARGN